MHAQSESSASRIYWLDVARVVAIISITLNHAVNRTYSGIYHEQYLDYAASSHVSMLIEVVCLIFSHVGVPLFLMISGALLLKKKMETYEDVLHFYRHNLLSLFITAEVWFFIMYWSITLTDGIVQSLPEMLLGCIKTMLFIDQVTMGSMWYMPMILCLYLLLPLLSLAMHKTSPRLFILPLSLVAICSFVIPNLNSLFHLLELDYSITPALYSSNLLSLYFLFVFLGYWISCGGLEKISTFLVSLFALLSFSATCAYQMFAFSCTYDYTIGYESIGILIYSVFTFELIRRGAHWVNTLEHPVTYLSQIAFGIYFVHIMIMQPIYARADFSTWHNVTHLAFLEAVSFLGSIIIIALLSKIPLLKRYMFMIKDGKPSLS